MLAMKLCIGNKRAKNRVNAIIEIIEEKQTIEYRKGSTNIISEKHSYNINTWNDLIKLIMHKRKINIKNDISKTIKITENEILMMLAIRFITEIK